MGGGVTVMKFEVTLMFTTVLFIATCQSYFWFHLLAKKSSQTFFLLLCFRVNSVNVMQKDRSDSASIGKH